MAPSLKLCKMCFSSHYEGLLLISYEEYLFVNFKDLLVFVKSYKYFFKELFLNKCYCFIPWYVYSIKDNIKGLGLSLQSKWWLRSKSIMLYIINDFEDKKLCKFWSHTLAFPKITLCKCVRYQEGFSEMEFTKLCSYK